MKGHHDEVNVTKKYQHGGLVHKARLQTSYETSTSRKHFTAKTETNITFRATRKTSIPLLPSARMLSVVQRKGRLPLHLPAKKNQITVNGKEAKKRPKAITVYKVNKSQQTKKRVSPRITNSKSVTIDDSEEESTISPNNAIDLGDREEPSLCIECIQCKYANKTIEKLQMDMQNLKKENQALGNAKLEEAPPISPTHSSPPVFSTPISTNDDERRTENVRKSYIRTKREYDDLHAAAFKLAKCTRGLDTTSFGEFGTHIRRLRSVLGLKMDEVDVVEGQFGTIS